MKIFIFRLFAILSLAVLAGCKTTGTATATKATGRTYVIVHGAWGGGWDWKHVSDLLTADGNTVYRVTLTGLGERSHLANTNIDLDTHIEDVANTILWENLHNVILVGHSYGGMVITGAADRVPDRIKRLVYIDALLPTNGESVNEMNRSNMKTKLQVENGFIIPGWVTNGTPPPHDFKQSALTFSQPITLTNSAAANIPITYILTVDKTNTPPFDPFYPYYQRAKARGCDVEIMEGNHTVERSHPHEVAKLLEEAR